MPPNPSERTISRFAGAISRELQPQLESVEATAGRVHRIRELALLAGRAIHLEWGLDLPHPAISATLLAQGASASSAMQWLESKIAFDNSLGCWMLPLAAEYDSKNRARYPTLSIAEFDAKGELAHRFVVRRLVGPSIVMNMSIMFAVGMPAAIYHTSR